MTERNRVSSKSGNARLRFSRTTRSRYGDRKSTRLNSSHGYISYAVFCLKKKKKNKSNTTKYIKHLITKTMTMHEFIKSRGHSFWRMDGSSLRTNTLRHYATTIVES